MANYKTFKQLVSQLAEVRTREDLWTYGAGIRPRHQKRGRKYENI